MIARHFGHAPYEGAAADEARHEEAYKLFSMKIFEIDPKGAIIAFEEMMRQGVVMPAGLMDNDKDPNLFDRFSSVTQRLGVYTAHDYAKIIEHLVAYWKLETLGGLTDVAARAQDYICALSKRYARLAGRLETKLEKYKPQPFDWIFNAVA